MKIQTLERYIRYTDIPYTKLLERAKKAGMLVWFFYNDGEIKVEDMRGHAIHLYPMNIMDIDAGMKFISYDYSK